MNSQPPNEPPKQLPLWNEPDDSQNTQRDASGQASIEKSALDESHSPMEKIVDDIILEMAWTRESDPTAVLLAPTEFRSMISPSGFGHNGKTFADDCLMERIGRKPSAASRSRNPLAAPASSAFQTCSTE